jgi:eukaryotic-like serine/threonine-protein kinase
MPLQSGSRLGSYEVTAPLGAGGMGEVYRARDPRLGRDVAIKVLPELFATDPDRVARFEREAKSVAQLSHPNILAIHDFAHEGRTAYAVMELLEGETLRDRVSAGPLPSRKAIEYAVQIARGLAAAHDKGIAHRDLKPENLFITTDDRVKILDFGLAKPLELGASNATVANTGGTAAGTVMGTVGYMAPEQVRGLVADHRADLFAFGAVLYEMLTGRRAFAGESPADTISAILNTEPPELETMAGGIPPAVDRIVRRCLEKKPELRFHSASDLAFALETLSTRGSGGMVATGQTATLTATPHRRLAAAVPWAVAGAAVAAAAAMWLFGSRSTNPQIPWQTFTAITDAAGVETTPTISPDGTTVAYATRASGTWDIHVQRVGGRTPLPIVADPEIDESGPAFSPDGLSVAFHRGRTGGIFVAGATGESVRRVAEFGFHAAWSPDGRRLAFSTEEISSPYGRLSDSGLWIIDVEGGTPKLVTGTADAAQPSWSPSGERIAFWSNTGGQRDIYTIPAAGGQRTAVTDDAALDWDPVWSPDGRFVYFSSDRGGAMNLWRIEIDEATGRTRGAPESVSTGVQAATEMAAFSKDGTRLVFRSAVNAVNPIAVPFDPVTLRAGTPVILNNSNSTRRPTSVSPDGKRLAFGNLDERQEDLFVSAIDGTGIRRLTDDAARDRVPVWSHDGKALFFYSNRGGHWEIWRVGADGGGLRKVVGVGPDGLLYPAVSPAGDQLVSSSAGSGFQIFISSLAPGIDPDKNFKPLAGSKVGDDPLAATDWSPDGSKLVGYFRNAGGLPVAIGVYDLKASRTTRVAEVGGFYIRWLPDSRHACFFSSDGQRLLVLDTLTGKLQAVDVKLPLPDGADAFAVAPDGRMIFYGGRRSEADIWIVERK